MRGSAGRGPRVVVPGAWVSPAEGGVAAVGAGRDEVGDGAADGGDGVGDLAEEGGRARGARRARRPGGGWPRGMEWDPQGRARRLRSRVRPQRALGGLRLLVGRAGAREASWAGGGGEGGVSGRGVCLVWGWTRNLRSREGECGADVGIGRAFGRSAHPRSCGRGLRCLGRGGPRAWVPRSAQLSARPGCVRQKAVGVGSDGAGTPTSAHGA